MHRESEPQERQHREDTVQAPPLVHPTRAQACLGAVQHLRWVLGLPHPVVYLVHQAPPLLRMVLEVLELHPARVVDFSVAPRVVLGRHLHQRVDFLDPVRLPRQPRDLVLLVPHRHRLVGDFLVVRTLLQPPSGVRLLEALQRRLPALEGLALPRPQRALEDSGPPHPAVDYLETQILLQLRLGVRHQHPSDLHLHLPLVLEDLARPRPRRDLEDLGRARHQAVGSLVRLLQAVTERQWGEGCLEDHKRPPLRCMGYRSSHCSNSFWELSHNPFLLPTHKLFLQLETKYWLSECVHSRTSRENWRRQTCGEEVLHALPQLRQVIMI